MSTGRDLGYKVKKIADELESRGDTPSHAAANALMSFAEPLMYSKTGQAVTKEALSLAFQEMMLELSAASDKLFR